MAASIEERWEQTCKIAREIRAHLAEPNSSSFDLIQRLQVYRHACEDLILEDFQSAIENEMENRLWEVHDQTNRSFRSQFGHFQTSVGRRKQVEQRKTTKRFLDFIKSGQRFYRGYIQRLASRFDGVKELDAVANRLTLSTLSCEDPIHVSNDLRQSVFVSCHQTLIRLGDISRWRETQVVSKDRNWGPAIGYYDLARRIHPQSGTCHNQLAVVALADEDHLRATYHFYRAMAIEEPHPLALSNLKIEFDKVDRTWEKGRTVEEDVVKNGVLPSRLPDIPWVRLHAQCHKGEQSREHIELEDEILDQLEAGLEKRSLEGALSKIVLMNIAGGYLANVRLQKISQTSFSQALRCFYSFQHLNLDTFSTLLKVLKSELVPPASSVNGPSLRLGSVTVVMRRVLPSLRNYSCWLLGNAVSLAGQESDRLFEMQLMQFWAMYATTLTLLASTFPILELPEISYLLEEDEDSLGFKPFNNEHTRRRFYRDDQVTPKPKCHDKDVERLHPTAEMLGRIRDLWLDGLDHDYQESVPISYVDGSLLYEDGTAAEPDHQAMDIDSKRMVNDLVGSEDEDEDPSEAAQVNGLMGGVDQIYKRYQASPTPNFSQMGNETSYGYIDSPAANELLDAINPPLPSPRFAVPPLPSTGQSPWPLQHGEERPALRPNGRKNKTPSHSQHNSLSGIPVQKSPGPIQVHSSNSVVPDATPDPSYNALNHDRSTLPAVAPKPRLSEAVPPAVFDASLTSSAEAFGGSSLEFREQGTVPPPNGQGP